VVSKTNFCLVPLSLEEDRRRNFISHWAFQMWRRPFTTTRNTSAADRTCASLESMHCGARTRSTCRSGKWTTKRVGLSGGMGRAMWSGVEMLSSSDYWDGVLGRLSLLVLCASESICFRALS
jgi:hypothetical protein